jgi:hypothetical protein
MKIIVRIVSAIFILMGTIWFLQGINVLPGSFMTGQMRWAVRGGILFVVGIAGCCGRNAIHNMPEKSELSCSARLQASTCQTCRQCPPKGGLYTTNI